MQWEKLKEENHTSEEIYFGKTAAQGVQEGQAASKHPQTFVQAH